MLCEMNPEQVEQLLRSEAVARIGCYGEGEVYVVPITYAYDGDSIYSHSYEGRKLRLMRENPNVCLEVEQIDNLANWRSVIVYGSFEQLAGEEAARGMELLMERFLPYFNVSGEAERSPHTAATTVPRGSHQTVVYRIRVTKKTGRFEKR